MPKKGGFLRGMKCPQCGNTKSIKKAESVVDGRKNIVILQVQCTHPYGCGYMDTTDKFRVDRSMSLIAREE